MVAPSSRLQAWRKLMIAPEATNSSEPSSNIVTWLSMSGLSCNVPTRIQLVPQVEGILGYQSSHLASASRHQVMTVPSRPPANNALAWRAASLPLLWRLRSVVAAASPVGKGSFSMLIIWRLAGTARNTPRHEMMITHGISHMQRAIMVAGRAAALSIMSVAIALTSPPLVIEPAAEAADCMALFSRMLKGGNHLGSARWRVAKMV